jgi:hypothetical protein
MQKFITNCFFVLSRTSNFSAIWPLAVAINGDRAANLDLCLALTAFSSEGSFNGTCHTYCNMGHPFLRSYLKDP